MKTYIDQELQVGCYVDESAGKAETCNLRTIKFARQFGFDPDRFEGMPDEEQDGDDYPDFLSQLADHAVDFLNEQETRTAMFWTFEDNSLFLIADPDQAKEQVEFVSSRKEEYPPADYRGEWLHVNDHGNATLYCRGDNEQDDEIWSVV